ncbi:hypothetical protein KUTeg_005879 [Tegillarca granosa]|uniref:Arrestin-like N-terminal domain-containing protein n=1 Tax=Tegillarca granosa TaxID=220873 RepID=A0ABQ9FJX4_TEGGR|nr:hypothetical protein KUTeg_005879 [Tegillarca granosa]
MAAAITIKRKNKKIVLPSGRHSYPFQFQLPPNLPASFEGEYGYIRYWVKALVEKPLKSFSHVTKSAFTIIGALDLNYFSDSNLCDRPVTAYLSLERKGFVPGEPVFINAEIENLSRRKMKDSSVELKMLKVDPMGPGFPLSVPAEIIVGTVPLHASVQQHLRLRQNIHQPGYYENAAGVYPPPPNVPNMRKYSDLKL